MSERDFYLSPTGNIYRLMRDSYYGDGGYRGAYLIPHKRETEQNYRDRQQTAYYLNHFSLIVNALVNPIFKRRPLRDWTGTASPVAEAFLEDVDGAGNDMDSFMQAAALSAKLYGAVFIVVENFQAMDLPASMGEALAQRKFPYAYTLDPDRVEGVSIDKNGRVLSIKFRDTAVSSTMGGEKERTVYFDTHSWAVYEDGALVSSGEHNLEEVPVVWFPSQHVKNGELNPTPELYPIAGISCSLYNHCSWLTEILRNQTFPLLTFPSKEASDLVIGNNNALCYDGDTVRFQPGFISPPSDPAALIQSQIKTMVEEMYRMAGLTFATTTKQEASGISRQWEFERTNQRLAAFAKRCAAAEKKILALVAKWMGLDLEYTATYSSDFGITDVATELKNAQAVLDMQLTDQLKVEVAKQVLSAYVPELPSDRFDAIIADIEKKARELDYNEPPQDGNPMPPEPQDDEGPEADDKEE
ncbi:MAG: hypothetical protein SOX98_02770 [Acidaminococcus fermentans]|nr:hypothetical protein [Acidaminococcus fermentans]